MYTITYDGNGEDGGAVPPTTGALPLLVSENDYTKAGYIFNGWNTAADGSGVSYLEFDPYNIAADVTLYAQWQITSGISVSGTLTPFTACDGDASAPQTLVVSGMGLEPFPAPSISIQMLPPGYELSTDAMLPAYSTSLRDFTFYADILGAVPSFNLYVRLAATANDGDGGDIWFDGMLAGGAPAPQVIKNTGSAVVTPVAITDGTDIAGLTSFQGVAGSPGNFTTSGTCLSGDLTVTAPAGFEVSTSSSSGFGSSVTLAPSSGTVASTTIYVRLAATQASAGAKDGDVTLSGGGASPQTVAVSGTVSAAPTYYVNYDSGDDGNNGTSAGTAWKTLGHAFGVGGLNTTDNAILYLSSGTHYLDNEIINGNDNLTIIGDGITSTILEPLAAGDQGIEVASTTTGLIIRDLKMQNFAEDSDGAALEFNNSGTVILQDIHFHNNEVTSTYDDGGAISVNSSASVTIDRCKFTENETHTSNSTGSCINMESSGTLTIQNCLFYDNDCEDNNGYSYGQGDVFIAEMQISSIVHLRKMEQQTLLFTTIVEQVLLQIVFFIIILIHTA